MTEPVLQNRERKFLAFILLSILVFVGIDLVLDYKAGSDWTHISVELFLAAGAAVGFVIVLAGSFEKTRRLTISESEAEAHRAEAIKWRAESLKHIQGLSSAIDTQLERWSLTRSEKEIALFLLKGLSLKEIASLRETSEKTTRAHCVALYSKSGLAGRSELAAFFLEDLLLPSGLGEIQ